MTEKKHEFAQEMVDFNQRFQEQIEKHVNDNAFTDRKWTGMIVGVSIFGGGGFIVGNGALVFGISGSRHPINGLTLV